METGGEEWRGGERDGEGRRGGERGGGVEERRE